MTNEQKRMQSAIDSTLAGMKEVDQLTARVLAAAENQPKRRPGRSAGLVLAAVMLLGVAAFAVAGGVRNVNWLGEPVPTEPVVSVSYDVEMDVMERILREEEITEAIFRTSDVPEKICITWPGDGEELGNRSSSQIVLHVRDMAHFEEAMADASYMPLPQWIPEGYEFVRGAIHYDCEPDGEMALFATEVTDDGLCVERYRSADGKVFPSFYALIFRRGSEELGIAANLSSDIDPIKYNFTLEEGETVRAIAAQQFDNALYGEWSGYHFLLIRNDLDQEIPCRVWHDMSVKAYQDVIATVQHPTLDERTLAAIFGIE